MVRGGEGGWCYLAGDTEDGFAKSTPWKTVLLISSVTSSVEASLLSPSLLAAENRV